jgi:hypothetical protein
MPKGTSNHAQVANTRLPAGERPINMPTFISGAHDTRAFLAWWRAACPVGLTAQLKAEKLMVVPSTADGFRATFSALRSLDWGGGFEFSHLHAPGGPLSANTGEEPGQRNAGELIREELEALDIHARESCICVPAVVTRTQRRNAHSPPTSLYHWREGPRFRRCDLSPIFEVWECRWSRTWLPSARCNANALSASAKRSVTSDTRHGASLVVDPTSPLGALPAGTASVLWLRWQPHRELQGLSRVERGEGSPCKASA